MLSPLTLVIYALSGIATVLAIFYAVRDRLINDLLLLLLLVLDLAVLFQAFFSLTAVSSMSGERATFVAYALSLPFVPPFAAWLAIKEKSRWAMITLAVGAFAVLVMTVRMEQIWNVYG